jgi:hypothetical protein
MQAVLAMLGMSRASFRFSTTQSYLLWSWKLDGVTPHSVMQTVMCYITHLEHCHHQNRCSVHGLGTLQSAQSIPGTQIIPGLQGLGKLQSPIKI